MTTKPYQVGDEHPSAEPPVGRTGDVLGWVRPREPVTFSASAGAGAGGSGGTNVREAGILDPKTAGLWGASAISSEEYKLAQASANAELRRALDEGVKFDDDKLRYDLVPPEAIEGLARVLTFGAKKYAPRNWEKGMTWGRVFGALMRHLWAWWRGEEKDPETGFSHLDHASCCIAFLQAYEVRHCGTDDRGMK